MTDPTPSTTPARDALRDATWTVWNYADAGIPEADALIDAYAHELAETIRAQHSAVYQDAGQKTADGLLRAADLIDPQVTP